MRFNILDIFPTFCDLTIRNPVNQQIIHLDCLSFPLRIPRINDSNMSSSGHNVTPYCTVCPLSFCIYHLCQFAKILFTVVVAREEAMTRCMIHDIICQ